MNSTQSLKTLTDALSQRLEGERLDLLVIGGGIVGAGIARDAAMRGLRTALVEQNDFASGTSSRSSRLLHGGLRYLAQGRVGLVREASREKRVLHDIAPHLADPLAFVFPTRRNSSWSRWKLSLGVKLYDFLCGGSNLGPSQTLNRQETLERIPGIAPTDLTGAVCYYDAQTQDARLVLDTLRSAERSQAVVGNYIRFQDAMSESGSWHSQLEDTRSGDAHTIRSRCVVNATGPWSDQLRLAKTSLRLTKGVHLVVDRSRLPLSDAVVMTDHDRILFAIPWGERLILGTTDTDYDGPIDAPTCDSADMQYVLGTVNRVFPKARLTASDVKSTWAGLRPLVADPHGNPSDLSRRHEIAMSHPGWWDVTGGKLTTYRQMAEETVDAIVQYLRVDVSPCRTASVPLLDARDIDGVSGIIPPAVSQSVVQHYCRNEWARHVEDIMVRRTSWQHYHKDPTEVASCVAQWMAECLEWSDDEREAELDRYRA